jgi:hypothetical protein
MYRSAEHGEDALGKGAVSEGACGRAKGARPQGCPPFRDAFFLAADPQPQLAPADGRDACCGPQDLRPHVDTPGAEI